MRIRLTYQHIKFSLLLIFGFLVLYYVLTKISIRTVAASVTGITPSLVFWFIFASLGVMLCVAARWQIILMARGYHVPFFRLLSYKIIGFSAGYVAPAPSIAGEPVRISMLGRHGITTSDATSTVVIDKTVELSLNLLFFLTGAFLIITTVTAPESLKYSVYISAVVVVSLVAYFYYQMLRGKHFFMTFFRALRLHRVRRLRRLGLELEIMERKVVQFYRRNKTYFFVAVFFTALSWAFMFMEYEALARMVGLDLRIQDIFLVFSMIGLTTIFPVPMGLGVMEAGQVGVSELVNFSKGSAVALSLAIRARDILWVLVGFSLLVYYQIESHRIEVRWPKKKHAWKFSMRRKS